MEKDDLCKSYRALKKIDKIMSWPETDVVEKCPYCDDMHVNPNFKPQINAAPLELDAEALHKIDILKTLV